MFKRITAGIAGLLLAIAGFAGTAAIAAGGTCSVYSGGGWLTGACPDSTALVPVERIGGATAIDTAVLISQVNTDPGVPAVYIANAKSMIDALSVSPFTDGPILLVPATGTLPASVAGELARLNPAKVVVLGGTSAVSNDMLGQAQTAAGK